MRILALIHNICRIVGIVHINMAIKIIDVSKKLGNRDILRSANLEIGSSEKLAIIGPTGCGKSTLLNILSGLDAPDSGSIIIDGIDITKMNLNQLSELRIEKIGFVFQSYYLQPHLTVLENVLIPSFVNKKISSEESDKRARLLLELVGLKEMINAKPATLSGGETQRVAIARALINFPKYIFADEPTGSLDHDTARNVMNLLNYLQERFGCALIIVTHDPAIASQANRRITISKGELINAD